MSKGTRSMVVAVTLLALTVPMTSLSPAAAQDATAVLEVDVDGGGPVFDFGRIYPGATEEAVVRISNRADEAGRVSLSAIDIVDESRCSPAETKEKMACGSGEGHLGRQMIFVIERLEAGSPSSVVWSGRLDDLRAVSLSGVGIPAGSTWEFRLGAQLPSWSGNETQNDRLAFDLRFDLEGEGGTLVAGSVIGRPSEPKILGITLPRTGVEATVLALVAGALLLIGAALMRQRSAVRRRSDRV